MDAADTDARVVAWKREAVFWREALNDGRPKTDVELDVILDRAGYFEDLIIKAARVAARH